MLKTRVLVYLGRQDLASWTDSTHLGGRLHGMSELER